MRNILYIFLFAIVLASCSAVHQPDGEISRLPQTFPDYNDVTLPANIAAPSFALNENAGDVQIEAGIVGKPATCLALGDTSCVAFENDDWHTLLNDAKGKDIFLRFCGNTNGKWLAYKDVICHVSKDDIDPYLVYRLIYPGYELWSEMGIYQRNLTNYDETAVIKNTSIGDKTCVNCHNFAHNDPKKMMLHVRGDNGGTMIIRDGKINKVSPAAQPADTTLAPSHGATYPSSDASGRYIAFSSNEVQQFFHAQGKKTIEVSDLSSDLFVYDTKTGNAITSKELCGDEWMETFPSWDGERGIYFCRTKRYQQGAALDSIRYDLCYVPFNTEKQTFGTPEVIYAASSEDFSCSFPRVSPDGKWLIFTRSKYGNFSIWHPEADLYLMNLTDRSIRPLDEVNSNNTESYHSWSSDGQWFVFSSRRIDGNWTRPYIAHFDTKTGRCGKPFLLPQTRPDFYLQRMESFNIPELITAPITNTDELLKAVKEQK